MAGGLTQTVLDLLGQYGYVAFFVFLFLETSMLFPLLPSEVVVPAAAALLIDGPLSFLGFVASGTLGATLGSYLLYWLFATFGEAALERYGRYVHISPAQIERGQAWFRRYGESSVLWGRLLPGLRSVVSIPAGLAEMSRRRFLVYSALGSLAFTASVGVLVAYGTQQLPHEAILDVLIGLFDRPLVAVGLVVLVGMVAVWWLARRR